MKTFGVSNKYTGPWLGEADRPDQALAKGRAMYGNDCPLYIATLDVMNIADGFPSIHVLIGDVRETLVEKHGSGADRIFDEAGVTQALDEWWNRMLEFDLLHVLSNVAAVDHMVADNIRMYSPGNDVKLNDFK